MSMLSMGIIFSSCLEKAILLAVPHRQFYIAPALFWQFSLSKPVMKCAHIIESVYGVFIFGLTKYLGLCYN